MSLSSGAFAAKLGHPGTSVKGATTAQNQVNLISDPSAGVTNGTITSLYDPSILTLAPVADNGATEFASVTAEPGFAIDQIVIQVTNGYYTLSFPPTSGTDIVLPNGLTQVGAVQVSWVSTTGTPVVVSDGTDDQGNRIYGDLTHNITFNLTPLGLSEEAGVLMATLSDQPSIGTGVQGSDTNPVGDFPEPDSYTDDDIMYSGSEIEGSSYTFQVQLPEPTALSFVAISGTLLLRRTRRML
jgi:hypothetical protein